MMVLVTERLLFYRVHIHLILIFVAFFSFLRSNLFELVAKYAIRLLASKRCAHCYKFVCEKAVAKKSKNHYYCYSH